MKYQQQEVSNPSRPLGDSVPLLCSGFPVSEMSNFFQDQGIPQIDDEIAKIGHLWIDTK